MWMPRALIGCRRDVTDRGPLSVFSYFFSCLSAWLTKRHKVTCKLPARLLEAWRQTYRKVPEKKHPPNPSTETADSTTFDQRSVLETTTRIHLGDIMVTFIHRATSTGTDIIDRLGPPPCLKLWLAVMSLPS